MPPGAKYALELVIYQEDFGPKSAPSGFDYFSDKGE